MLWGKPEQISNSDWIKLLKPTCTHPEHNGPSSILMVIPPEGIIFSCPACGKKTRMFGSVQVRC